MSVHTSTDGMYHPTEQCGEWCGRPEENDIRLVSLQMIRYVHETILKLVPGESDVFTILDERYTVIGWDNAAKMLICKRETSKAHVSHT